MKPEKKYCCQRVLYGVKRNIAANEAHFWDCCSNVGHFLCGVARVKRYVNLYMRLYRQHPETDNQNVDFAYPGKIFAAAHACVTCVYNLTSALSFANLETENKKLKQQNVHLVNQVLNLGNQINDLEQYGRRQNLEIQGVAMNDDQETPQELECSMWMEVLIKMILMSCID